jgi:hypothetical protein
MKTETAKRLLELEIKNLHYAIETANKIMPIVEKFNGKQPNKRLDTALKQIDKGLSFETRYNSFIISLFLTDRHVPDGENHIAYVAEHSKNLIHDSIQSVYGKGGACQEGVIRSDILKEDLIAFIDHSKELIGKFKIESNSLDELIKEHEAIKETISQYENKISYLTRNYLSLKF